MPLVPREKIDDVRERTNIVDIVKRHVELKRAGTGSWKGLCPFHAEKTPSFHVHEPRQFFHCFGCGEKGDVISFLVKIEQRPFMDVLTDLAGPAGVDLEVRPLTPAEKRARQEQESERERMFRALELATSFFEQQYDSPAGAAARAYVEGRGIGPEVRQKFRVGYAPARWDALSSHLSSHHLPYSVMEQLGLVGVSERGRYDFFRDRVMLPVLDRQRRVVGFGGRLLDPEAKDRKYVNSPESPLFHKKEQLYGLHAAQEAIRKTGRAVVVEGNFDVLALHQAGIEEAVAPMGTALTLEQITGLGRLAKTVTVVFDGDTAGQRAAQKAVPLFVEGDVDGRVARLPAGVDPDDFVRGKSGGGPDAFRRLVEGARPMLDQFIQDSAEEASIPGKMAALERVTDLLVRVRNTTERELYAGQLAGVLGMTTQQVTRALREAAARAQRPATASTPAQPAAAPAITLAKLPPEELHLVVLLARYPELVASAEANRASELLVHPALRRLYRAATTALGEAGRLDVAAWLDAAPPDVAPTVSAALMDGSLADVADPPSLLRKLSARLQLQRLEAEMAMNERQSRQAHTQGDLEALRALSLRGIELRKTKEGLQAALQRP
ncbi:MAG TPA: DNA primase [Polyangia bacterium]|nr:DNA primase [Polyangia bacterium]